MCIVPALHNDRDTGCPNCNTAGRCPAEGPVGIAMRLPGKCYLRCAWISGTGAYPKGGNIDHGAGRPANAVILVCHGLLPGVNPMAAGQIQFLAMGAELASEQCPPNHIGGVLEGVF